MAVAVILFFPKQTVSVQAFPVYFSETYVYKKDENFGLFMTKKTCNCRQIEDIRVVTCPKYS